jgi:hypothetical protein
MGHAGPKYCVRGMNGLKGNGSRRGIDRSHEWGMFRSFNSVIPTGTDRRKAMICEVEGPAVVKSIERVGIESE